MGTKRLIICLLSWQRYGNKKSCDGYDDYEYNMILDNFVELSKPISASQMKDITDSSFNFRQTMFSISEEAAKKIINYVRNNN